MRTTRTVITIRISCKNAGKTNTQKNEHSIGIIMILMIITVLKHYSNGNIGACGALKIRAGFCNSVHAVFCRFSTGAVSRTGF